MINRFKSILLMLGVLFLSASCEQKQVFNSLDITGIQGYGSDFRLNDHTGKPRTLADFRGKVVVMFFGYTQCPDVCPTTLSEMRQAMQLLGKDAGKVQILFVTVDPGRDTPELLSKYVPAFNETFLGLSGDAAATEKVTRDFKILYRIQPGKSPGSYTVDHTAASLVFDATGKLRLFVNYGLGAEKLAADVRQLLMGAP